MLKEVDVETAIKRKYPEGVVLVVTKDKRGKVNFAPVSWATNASNNPRTWIISLYKGHRTTKNIQSTKEFVICFPSKKQAKDVSYCGRVSGNKVDKSKKCKFTLLKSKIIKVPLIEDSVACFECKLLKEVRLPKIDHIVFIGAVLKAYISNEKKRLFHWGNYKVDIIK
jgi:flavin reductase (DIM6/NTAB) family NADH-FMN oxidoreductase RutF